IWILLIRGNKHFSFFILENQFSAGISETTEVLMVIKRSRCLSFVLSQNRGPNSETFPCFYTKCNHLLSGSHLIKMGHFLSGGPDQIAGSVLILDCWFIMSVNLFYENVSMI
ncbi:hypothetical protein ATANTOWER_003411, partial [Ataeniobius toweri]|nr:hypothetical protein [Ataeniobius toweri]